MRNLTDVEAENILNGKEVLNNDGMIYNPEVKGFNPILLENGKVNIISNCVISVDDTSMGAE